MKPLSGIKILDLSRVLASPFASMVLAELGADVIKIEQPGDGDETRSYEPKAQGDNGSVSGYFMALNRSKRSMTLNLQKEEGRDIVRQLAAKSDVLLENFPAGKMSDWGLGWDQLKAINPKLVYVSCTGFGQTGAHAARKGYDTVFQAMSGVMSLTGEKGGGPVKPGLPVADLTSGLWIALGVLAALQGRAQTGNGSYTDFAMLDGLIGLLSIAAARWFALGEVPPRMGTEHPGRVPSASFRCADNKWLHITGTDRHWPGLCAALDLDKAMMRDELLRNVGRVTNRDEVMGTLSGALATITRDEALARLEMHDIPSGPVLELDEVLTGDYVKDRGLVSAFDHPLLGSFPMIRLPYRFDGLDNPEPQRPPLLGEHTDEILRDVLGFSRERIARLRADKVA